MAKIENVFDGYGITVVIPASARLTAAHKKAIQKEFGGKGSVELQQHCAVAEAMNEAFGAVYDAGRGRVEARDVLDFGDLGRFMLNKSAHARFGLDHSNKMFLTVSLVEEGESEDSARYRLTWRGDAIPQELARIGVAHDSGEQHPETAVELLLGDAQLVRPQKDPRPNTRERREQKNGPASRKGQPRKHRRICAEDIERTYAAS